MSDLESHHLGADEGTAQTHAKLEGFVAEAGRRARSLTLPEPWMPDVAAPAEVAADCDNELVGPPLVVGR